MPAVNVNMIALRVTRYSDRQSILTAYSREKGRLSIALPAGKGRATGRIQALTMPLSIVQGVVDLRPGREIVNISGLHTVTPLHSLHSHPIKQMSGQFMAEVLSALLRDNEGDESVWNFLEGAVQAFDALTDWRAVANFNPWFLYRLGALLGVEPDVSTFTPGAILDLRDGRWRRSAPLHDDRLDVAESRAAWLLSRMNLGNLHCFRYSLVERNRLIDHVIDYLSLHLVSLRSLRSLDILRSLF